MRNRTEYQREWRKKNREKLNEYKRKRYHGVDHDKQLAAHKAWREKNPDYYKVRGKIRTASGEYREYWKNKGKRKQYGLSEEQFLEIMPRLEVGPCEICGTTVGPFHIDHDHKTKKFRGVLCKSCNHVLGFAHDNQFILLAAVQYLNRN